MIWGIRIASFLSHHAVEGHPEKSVEAVCNWLRYVGMSLAMGDMKLRKGSMWHNRNVRV